MRYFFERKPMSDYDFLSLNKPELAFLADEFGALVKGTTKQDFADALSERPITADDVKEALKQRQQRILESHPNHKEPVILKDDDVTLIRMRRANPTFEYRNYTFTQQHPYVLMSVADANDLLRMETGFLMASPEEAKEFYGRS
jgi:hypothetical protein